MVSVNGIIAYLPGNKSIACAHVLEKYTYALRAMMRFILNSEMRTFDPERVTSTKPMPVGYVMHAPARPLRRVSVRASTLLGSNPNLETVEYI